MNAKKESRGDLQHQTAGQGTGFVKSLSESSLLPSTLKCQCPDPIAEAGDRSMVARDVRFKADQDLSLNFYTAILSFLAYCQGKGLSPETIGYYERRMQAFIRWLEKHAPGTTPQQVTRQLIREFVADEVKRTSAATANHAITALRVFFNYLVREEFISTNPMLGVEKVKMRKPIIKTFTSEQIESILATCDKSFTGTRDRAIMCTLYDSGLRASELCGLTVSDLDLKEQTFKVLGKGGRERIIPFGGTTKQAILSYLAHRGNEVSTDRLYCSCYGDPLTRFRLREIIKDRCKRAGITGLRCSPHTLRHSAAVSMLRNGSDSLVVQRYLGHSSLDMTRRYCELADTDVQEHHRLYSPADRLQMPKQTVGRRRLK